MSGSFEEKQMEPVQADDLSPLFSSVCTVDKYCIRNRIASSTVAHCTGEPW